LKKLSLIAAVLALTPAIAMADAGMMSDKTINAKVSTLGAGVEVAFPIRESVDARIGFNTFSYNFNKTAASATTSTNYSGKLDLQSFQALADWHPMAGSFRVSGGLIYNNNSFNMTALAGSGSTIALANGTVHTLTGAESVNANISFDKIAPYLGFGWGRTPKNTGLSFTSDFGIMFQGAPKGSVTTANVPVAVDTAKANADLNSSLSSFKMYPVASIGIGYTF
jgi:hypothetical protein